MKLTQFFSILSLVFSDAGSVPETGLEHSVKKIEDIAVFRCKGWIRWSYKPIGANRSVLGGNKTITTINYTDRFSFNYNPIKNESVLYINSTRSEDAGTFSCVSKSDANDSTSSIRSTTFAELIILGANPTCNQVEQKTNNSYRFMQCRVNFTSNWIPQMEWIYENGTIINHGAECSIQNLSKTVMEITCRLTVIMTSDITNYQCRTYFSSTGTLIKYPESARNVSQSIPNYNNICSVNLTRIDPNRKDNSVLLLGLFMGCGFLGFVLVSVIVVFIVRVKRKRASEQGTLHVPYMNHNDYVALPVMRSSVETRLLSNQPQHSTDDHLQGRNTERRDKNRSNQTVCGDGTIYAELDNVAQREWLRNNPTNPPPAQGPSRYVDTSDYASLDHMAMSKVC